MKVRFSVLVAMTAVVVAIVAYIGYLVGTEVLYKQQAQPIAFPHDLHAGVRQIACQYCHRGTEKGLSAGVPSVKECMDCHKWMPSLTPNYLTGGKADPAQHPGMDTLFRTYWFNDADGAKLAAKKQKDPNATYALEADKDPQPIQWWKVYQLPDHARFPHAAHIAKGFQCTDCHGAVNQMNVLKPAEREWPMNIKLMSLGKIGIGMGWCISCHRGNNSLKAQGPQQCSACHY